MEEGKKTQEEKEKKMRDLEKKGHRGEEGISKVSGKRGRRRGITMRRTKIKRRKKCGTRRSRRTKTNIFRNMYRRGYRRIGN